MVASCVNEVDMWILFADVCIITKKCRNGYLYKNENSIDYFPEINVFDWEL